jgi:DNA repair photolyase
MHYKQVNVNSLINKITKKDTLFGGQYTIDPYQNCEFGCLYCDSSFNKKIYIKKNAKDLFRKEIKLIDKGVIIIGSVHDPYQNVENDYKITRSLLKIIEKSKIKCHILTKSDLILRDIDILSKIKGCIVTISLVSLKDSISNIFESNVPSSKIRLKTIEKLSEANIRVGLANIPILPYISDKEIENIIKSAKNYSANRFLYKHLELKGDQRLYFFDILDRYYPALTEKYKKLYHNSYSPDIKYILKIKKTVEKFCKEFGLKNHI